MRCSMYIDLIYCTVDQHVDGNTIQMDEVSMLGASLVYDETLKMIIFSLEGVYVWLLQIMGV